MNFLKRLFNLGMAEANDALDKLEDPIKMTEQGIRDLKEDLNKSLQGLAELKALAIRTKRDQATAIQQSREAENKAVMLLQKAAAGHIAQSEADRLASEMLRKKQETDNQANYLGQEVIKHEESVAKMSQAIQTLKTKINAYENEARTLKARAKVSAATKKINKQLSQIDSSSTVAMLERMKEKVAQDEALAESYSEINNETRSVDDEVNKVLASTPDSSALLELKAKLNLLGSGATGTSNPNLLKGDGSI